jgi:hypothetical protein
MSCPSCPLLFTFRDTVSGNGYFARVAFHGRALAVREDDGVWMYGVQPGGLAAGGKDEGEAYLTFRQEYTAVLYDIAAEATTFDEFRAEVQSFFDQASQDTLQAWEAAVEDVRKNKVNVEGIPRQPAESPRYVEVEIAKPSAAVNALDTPRRLAA